MPVRMWQAGDYIEQLSNLNKSVQDILTSSGYLGDGTNFDGFAKVFPIEAGEVGVVYTTFPRGDSRRYGIIGDGSDQTVLIDNMIASVPSTGGQVRFTSGTYKKTTNLFAALIANAPCVVFLDGAELITTVQIVLPRECRIIGLGRGISSLSSPGRRGSVISADSTTFPNDGTAIVRLGRAGVTNEFGVRLENLMVDGQGMTNVMGVYSTNPNEQTGLRNVIIAHVGAGLKIEKVGTEQPHNWFVHDVEVHLNATATGIAFEVDGGDGLTCFDMHRCTATRNSQVTVAGTTAFRINGVNGGVGIGLHAEAYETAFKIGDMAGRSVNGLVLISVTGAIVGMVDGVLISNVGAVRDFTLIGASTSNATNVMRDLVNGVTYTNGRVPFYSFGSLALGSAASKIIACNFGARQALVYGVNVPVDCYRGLYCTLTVTNGVGFTIANPTNAIEGDVLTLEILNNSGGAMGAITWGTDFVYRDGSWVNPANTKRRVIKFQRRATSWAQISPATGDM